MDPISGCSGLLGTVVAAATRGAGGSGVTWRRPSDPASMSSSRRGLSAGDLPVAAWLADRIVAGGDRRGLFVRDRMMRLCSEFSGARKTAGEAPSDICSGCE